MVLLKYGIYECVFIFGTHAVLFLGSVLDQSAPLDFHGIEVTTRELPPKKRINHGL